MACLDTSFIIDLLQNNGKVYEILHDLETAEKQLSVPAPVVMELWIGICSQERSSEEKKKVLQLFQSLKILPLDEVAAKESAEIRYFLKKKGKAIGTEDCMIAAIAKVNNETLVTMDSDFLSIEGLRIFKY